MSELPSWDEIDQRLMGLNPKVAAIVAEGLNDHRDDGDKRLVIDIIEALHRGPMMPAEKRGEAWDAARVAVRRFEECINLGAFQDPTGTEAHDTLVDIIGNTITDLLERQKRERGN